jgi:glycosyltransferase involved in cell wall biosynthesis
MKIILGHSQGVNYHRLFNPFRYFKAEFVAEVTEPEDIIVYNVRGIHQSLASIKELQLKGSKVWVDIDDWVERPLWHLNRQANELEITSNIIAHLRNADIVTTASKRLRDELYKQFNIQSILVHNAITTGGTQVEHELSFGWIGTLSHHLDHRLLAIPLFHKYKASRVLGGASGYVPEYWEHLQRIWSGNWQHQVKVLEAVEVDDYMDMYGLIDFALLPSYDDLYTSCKSNLKLLESAASAIPIITNGGTYSDVKQYQGIRVNGAKEWRKAIELLIRSEHQRNEYALGLQDYAKDYTMQKSYDIRCQIINTLLNKN